MKLLRIEDFITKEEELKSKDNDPHIYGHLKRIFSYSNWLKEKLNEKMFKSENNDDLVFNGFNHLEKSEIREIVNSYENIGSFSRVFSPEILSQYINNKFDGTLDV